MDVEENNPNQSLLMLMMELDITAQERGLKSLKSLLTAA